MELEAGVELGKSEGRCERDGTSRRRGGEAAGAVVLAGDGVHALRNWVGWVSMLKRSESVSG
jgi:hypothetical protein